MVSRADYLEDQGIIELLREGLETMAGCEDVKRAGKVAEVAEQTGHGVTHPDADTEQARQHSRDMARLDKMHEQGNKAKR
jgi:hypothetical protein